MAPFF
jgi:hypothetical protein